MVPTRVNAPPSCLFPFTLEGHGPPSTAMRHESAVDAILESLRAELGLAIRASKDAGDYATHDESRAKSKYDTQGLESSYLAAGQAERAEEIALAVLELEKLRENPPQGDKVGPGSLVECDWGKDRDWFLIVRSGGGTVGKVGKSTVTAITPESAAGSALAGKSEGESFKLATGAGGVIRQVINL